MSRIVSACALDARGRGEAHAAHPRERRVPRRVDPARDEVLHLALVVRVQDVVEVEVLLGEPAAEAVPDRDDLRVVRDRAHQQRVVALVPSSHVSEQREAGERAADEVAQRVGGRRHHARRPRASRNRRSTPSSRRNAAPPHTFIARSVTVDRRPRPRRPSPRARAASRPPARSRRRCSVSLIERVGAVGRDLHLREVERAVPAAGRGVWPRCSSWVAVRCAMVSAVTARMSPTLNAAEQMRNHGSTTVESDVEAGAVVAEPVAGRDDRAVGAAPGGTRCPAGRGRRSRRRPRRPGVSAGTSHSVIGPVGRYGPARPHVAVGLAGRRDPALRRVEPHSGVLVGRRRGEREPRSGSGCRPRRTRAWSGARPAAIARRTSSGPRASMRRGGGVVHDHDHRGRAARLREPGHDVGSGTQALAAAADLGRRAQRRGCRPRPSASRLARGKAPVRSISAALGATTSSITRVSAALVVHGGSSCGSAFV